MKRIAGVTQHIKYYELHKCNPYFNYFVKVLGIRYAFNKELIFKSSIFFL